MVTSMTGYGRGTDIGPVGTVTVEIKTVNSRFLELNLRSNGVPLAAEEAARAMAKEALTRGKVYLSVMFLPAGGADAVHAAVDDALLDASLDAIRAVQKKYGLKKQKLLVRDLLALPVPWLVLQKEEVSEKDLIPLVQRAAAHALEELNRMRKQEGEALVKDLSERLGFLKEQLEMLRSLQGRAAAAYGERLHARISALLETAKAEADDGRILQEIAVYAEKTDYTEELVRFESHLAQFERILREDGQVGRKLDFLVQELNREINTMGSKANDLEITDCVIAVKTELEKIREQIQNLE